MKYGSTYLSLVFIFFFSGNLFALNLEIFRVDQKPAVDKSGPDQKTVMNVLIFPEMNLDIPLARSAVIRDESSNRDDHLGFDPDTLKIEWLKKDEMIWVHWDTFSQGTGGFNHEGHIVLNLVGNQWKEIFRDNFMSYSKGGWWHHSSNSLNISFDRSLRLLKLKFSGEDFSAVDEKPKVFTTIEIDDTVSGNSSQGGKYSYTVVEKTILTYEVSNENIIFQYGYKTFDAGKNRFLFEDLAGKFQTTVADLRRLNHPKKGGKYLTGEIIVGDHLEPLKTDDDDGLSGGL